MKYEVPATQRLNVISIPRCIQKPPFPAHTCVGNICRKWYGQFSWTIEPYPRLYVCTQRHKIICVSPDHPITDCIPIRQYKQTWTHHLLHNLVCPYIAHINHTLTERQVCYYQCLTHPCTALTLQYNSQKD